MTDGTRSFAVAVFGERFGRVRDAFIRRGHRAVSVDLLASEAGGPHIQADYLTIDLTGIELVIAHPTCTYLCSSGLHRNTRDPSRAIKTEQAIEHVRKVLSLPVKRLAMENPIGCISTRIREPDQIIQPYQFGADASKATCLWLNNLPPLRFTSFVTPRICWDERGKPAMRWANQTDSGQNRLGPSEDRWAKRSVTYPGIAEAMAEQWGTLLLAANQDGVSTR